MTDLSTDDFRSSKSVQKFSDPDWTAKGEKRASVALDKLDTLWFNTGTLCNIECVNCYIESSPKNDRLVYISADEITAYLDEIERDGWNTREIGFTGGEPFMNPDMIAMTEDALKRGFEVLILTNAMQPMMRPTVRDGLLRLQDAYGERLTLRVSLDHYSDRLHDMERGPGSFAKAIEGMDWLDANGFTMAVAGRTCWDETETAGRDGYRALFEARGYRIDADDPMALVLFPEMDMKDDVPEITTACWDILSVPPSSVMCASSRMIVKRKGESAPKVLPCTLLPYDAEFEMGETLAQSNAADGGNFSDGAVKLNPSLLRQVLCARWRVLLGVN